MKISIIALLVGAIGVWAGYVLQGHIERENMPKMQSIDYYLTLTYDEIGHLLVHRNSPQDIIYALCQEVNNLKQNIWGKIWAKSKSLGYDNPHNTPWSEFTIEEKATIAMYGGSGSKLEPEEIDEWAGKYGKYGKN